MSIAFAHPKGSTLGRRESDLESLVSFPSNATGPLLRTLCGRLRLDGSLDLVAIR